MKVMRNKFPLPLLSLLTISLCQICRGADDIVLAGFEGTTYGGWKAQGTAFGNGPTLGKRMFELEVQGVRGNGFASSENEGDKPVGMLTSPVFIIARKYISFGGILTWIIFYRPTRRSDCRSQRNRSITRLFDRSFISPLASGMKTA